MSQGPEHCTKCGGPFFWNPEKPHPGAIPRKRKPTSILCGKCLPENGLPEGWPDMHPGVVPGGYSSFSGWIPKGSLGEAGVTAVEYAVMLVLVALAIITASTPIKKAVVDVFNTVAQALQAGL